MHAMILRIVIGTIIGGAAGYAWHALVGCRTGSCPITANPYTSIIFGAVMGFLFTMK